VEAAFIYSEIYKIREGSKNILKKLKEKVRTR